MTTESVYAEAVALLAINDEPSKARLRMLASLHSGLLEEAQRRLDEQNKRFAEACKKVESKEPSVLTWTGVSANGEVVTITSAVPVADAPVMCPFVQTNEPSVPPTFTVTEIPAPKKPRKRGKKA